MRGLAFPTSAVFNRETSYEYGTPVDDIPIDPALSAAAPMIDPAIMGEGSGAMQEQIQLQPTQYSRELRQYSQGPQGDPFAPQPVPYLPIEEEVAQPTQKVAKRKRKPRREEECGFCQGTDEKNKDGGPEIMVTCEECGRSGHPSCMELGEVSEVVKSYPWKCIECKTCEVCQEKGDDERILFCDFCDRGWHMDCLSPALEESPPGKWHCPMCPPVEWAPPEPEPQPEMGFHPPSPVSSPRTRRGKAAPTDDSEVDVDDTPTTATTRTKRRSRKGKARAATASDDEEEPSSPAPVRAPKRMRLRVHSPVPPPPKGNPRMVVRLKLPPKGKGKEREDGDGGLFEDILSVEQRDISKTGVEYGDKQRFEKSRTAAEEKLIPPPPPSSVPDVPDTPIAGPSTRPLRSAALHQLSTPAFTSGRSTSPTSSTPAPVPSSSTSGLRIRTIRFGQFDIQTWYDAPFPEEYATIPDGRLWICEFCLKYMKSRFGAVRHRMKCKARHPPGDEIYRDGTVSIFEVDGRKNKIYCQNLCLLSKMFLDHKSLFYDVEPFLFYVMTEVDDVGARFVGYFSKEKRSPKDYNVSCIMTLPVRQRQGWGNLLIDFSYLLSKKERRAGSPEKPLSGLGALGYKNYWTLAIMRYLETAPDKPRLEDISAATSMTVEDIHTILTQQNFLRFREPSPLSVRPTPGQSIKFPRGRKNGVARRNLQRTQTQDEENPPKTPFVAPTKYEIRWDREKVDQYLRGWEAKGYLHLKPEKLKWTPFLMARTNKTEAAEAPSIETTPAKNGLPESTPEDNTARVIQDLFADDVVPSPSVTNAPDPVVPASSPANQDQVEQDRALAEEMASPAKRRLRSQSSTQGILSNSPRSRIESKDQNMEVQRPGIGRRTRSGSARTTEKEQKIVDDAIAGDEALAAKLALEDKRPNRQLRSRSEVVPELKRTGSRTSSSKAPSPRKRRRVESSPEAEVSPPSATNIDNDTETSLPCAEVSETGSPGLHKPPQLLNGSDLVEEATQRTPTLSREPPVMNGRRSPPPVPINGGKSLTTVITINIHGNREQSEVKSEDMGTPLTGMTSRHSIPSDDTIAAEMNGKDVGPHRVLLPGHDRMQVNGLGCDEGDEDADAEGEVDAEGEPDVEVETY